MSNAAATIQQIAQETGVSMPTVRHILGNRADRYKAETREKVLRVARDLGYRPHGSARAMRTGRFGCAVLLMSTREYRSNLPVGLLDGIHDALAERGMHLTLARMPDEDLQDDRLIPKFLREWMADGLIINYTHDLPPRLAGLIREHDIPSVWVNVNLDADCVRPDDFAAGRAAAEHLIGLGHRRIAFARLIQSAHYSVAERGAGYEAALRAAGLEPAFLSSLPGPGEPWPDATAMIAYGDMEAQRVLAAARAAGRRVPEDLSVVTFSPAPEPPEDPLTERAVTTFLLPEYALGRDAVAMLLRKIEEPDALVPCRTSPPVFRPGGTDAAPRTT